MSATDKNMTVRQAAFIGVGAMVGAGIFALLAVGLGLWWKHVRPAEAAQVQEPAG